jgi:hypothetical protein
MQLASRGEEAGYMPVACCRLDNHSQCSSIRIDVGALRSVQRSADSCRSECPFVPGLSCGVVGGENCCSHFGHQTRPASGLKSSSTRVPHLGQTADAKDSASVGHQQLGLCGERGVVARALTLPSELSTRNLHAVCPELAVQQQGEHAIMRLSKSRKMHNPWRAATP